MIRTKNSLVALSLALLSGCTMAVQETHFFHPGPASTPASPEFARIAESHTIPSVEGASLGAVYIKSENAAVDVLYFGGDSFKIDDFGPYIAKAVAPVGANYFIVDHRGYGRSTGTPSLMAVGIDSVVAYDYLDARNGDRPIVVHGFSLGSFLAANLANVRPVGGLVLESTATSVKDWANEQVPGYASPFVRIKIAKALQSVSNVDVVEKYHGPLLLLTGSRDTITPPSFARKLYDRSATPAALKRVAIVKDRRHGDVLESGDAISELKAFLDIVAKHHSAASTGS